MAVGDSRRATLPGNTAAASS